MKKYIPGMILTLLLGLFGVFNADTMALDSDYKNNLLKLLYFLRRYSSAWWQGYFGNYAGICGHHHKGFPCGEHNTA